MNGANISLCTVLSLFIVSSLYTSAPGTLDTTFNPTGTPPGTVVTNTHQQDGAKSVTIQQDGKIVVAGSALIGGVRQFELVRYLSNGSLDATFGTGGIVTTPIGTNDAVATSIVLQPDGKLVAAGFATVGTEQFAVARYNSNGSLDTTFGTGGIVTTPIGTDAQALGMVLQPDGKLVVTGFASILGTGKIVVVRYNSDGSLDSSFGTGGIVITTIGGLSDFGRAVTLQKDGKIVVTGNAVVAGTSQFALVRYNTDGSLDTSFNGSGIVTTPLGNTAQGNAVTLQPDGKIVVAGFSDIIGSREIIVLRYLSNGSLDTSFNGTGIAPADITASADDESYGVAVQQNGKIVVAGFANIAVSEFAVVRFTPNGSLDSTFNSNGTQPGIVTTAIGFASRGNAVALQSDGKIVVAGNNSDAIAVARYNGDPVNPCVVRLVNKYGFVL